MKINISIFFLLLSIFATCLANPAELCAPPLKSTVVINVKEIGAKGDGVANDTAAIQAAVNQVSGTGGSVFVPEGIYMVDSVVGINIGSDMNFVLSNSAVIRAIPNDKDSYSILRLKKSSNVVIKGGVLIGDRASHKATAGEWGMGMTILESRNIIVDSVVSRDNWGDGFYISGLSRNVRLCSVIADNNRRQGLSVISVDGLIVEGSTFINTVGTPPQAGIDIEPNVGDSVNNVMIINSKLIGNKGWGLLLVLPRKPKNTDFIKNVTVDGNYISGNTLGGIGVIDAVNSYFLRNTIVNNLNYGIVLYKGSSKNKVFGNRIIGSKTILDHGGNQVGDN